MSSACIIYWVINVREGLQGTLPAPLRKTLGLQIETCGWVCPMEGSRQGALKELDEPKAAVRGPQVPQGPRHLSFTFVMPGKTQCVPIYWFRHAACLLESLGIQL